MTDQFVSTWRRGRLARLLGRPGELEIVPLADALAALGTARGHVVTSEYKVPVDDIVGTVARAGDFDRLFRPRSRALRERWEAVAATDLELPPVRLIRVGEMYFAEDGHHRVSIARARGQATIAASVRWLCTVAHAPRCLTLADLPVKAAERAFLERVPLPDPLRFGLWLDCRSSWSRLAESAEAWGFRHGILDRDRLAARWWAEEVVPVLRASKVPPEPASIGWYFTELLAREGR
ncbi:hypothetical protein [Amycolatopsis nigrescens]|uniref:hypothetical protein n=1 Tax=Amycolatopsis nigrescens TaxID=381445 RepID=UPI00036ED3A1|nr:hypothetical protein [Amycolatopsis nigrescens]